MTVTGASDAVGAAVWVATSGGRETRDWTTDAEVAVVATLVMIVEDDGAAKVDETVTLDASATIGRRVLSGSALGSWVLVAVFDDITSGRFCWMSGAWGD